MRPRLWSRLFKLLLVVLAAIAAGAASWLWAPSLGRLVAERLPPTWTINIVAWLRGIEVDHEQSVTTPDGTRLATSLYRPSQSGAALPTVLIRLPYHRLRYAEGYATALHFARHGYAVLVQDLRGSGGSGGEFLPWQNSADDAVATIEWITRQPWSNGKVASIGCSALGETQLVAQHRAPGAWRAMIASGAGGAAGSLGGRYEFGFYEGGVLQLASAVGWYIAAGSKRPDAPPAAPFDHAQLLGQLPVSGLVARVRPSPNGYSDFMSAPLDDARWAQWGFLGDDSRMRVPTLLINTWADQTVSGTIAIAEHWRRSDPVSTRGRLKTILAPGNHCEQFMPGQTAHFGALDIENAGLDYAHLARRWFDYWLKGQGDALAELPAYTYYVIGAGRWRTSDTWPPAETQRQRWWLGSGKGANSAAGDGSLTREQRAGAVSDTWRYDPADPVPARGGPLCCTGTSEPSGPADQADVERRQDVLVYTSGPLEEDLVIAGPIRLHVEVSSDARDTDLVGRLAHVFPDGRSISIQEGALRLRYRDGFTMPKLMEPGQRVKATVDMRDIAYRLPKGHRLRLHLTSSSFPRLERNLNTGGHNATETHMVVASTQVHYDRPDAGSWLELSVLRDLPTGSPGR